jgi:hypothetical protein
MTAVSLIKHETTLGAAIATSNLEVLNALTHPSFTYLGMHPGGVSAWTRSEWVNVVCGLNTISFVHNTPNVVLVGTTAVVTVDATWLGQISGAPRQQRVLMSDTWLKVNGRWKLLRRHASTFEEAVSTARDGAAVYL